MALQPALARADTPTPGDIPDNQAFVRITGPGYSLSTPEGWARVTRGKVVTLSDKYNAISIRVGSAPAAPTVGSVTAKELPALRSATPGFRAPKITAVTRPAGRAVLDPLPGAQPSRCGHGPHRGQRCRAVRVLEGRPPRRRDVAGTARVRQRRPLADRHDVVPVAMTRILEARDLYRFYHAGDEETLALRGVSADGRARRAVAVIGPSGSGKSTLLACIAGLDEPDGGVVDVAGERVSRRSETVRAAIRARSIGMLFQSGNLLGHLSVEGNVLLAQQLGGHADIAAASAILESVGPRARAPTLCRRSSRAESSPAQGSPWPWPTIRRSCSPTSRPASSTPTRPT